MPRRDLVRAESAPDGVSLLTDKEKNAFKFFVETKQHELSEDLSSKLFSLFQQGKDCDSIRKLSPGVGLGAIIHARIRDKWDERKNGSMQVLRNEVPQMAERAQLESVEFISKLASVAHRQFGEKLDEFLITGDKTLLAGTPFEKMSLRTYREIVEMLARATGQDQKKTVKVTGGITVTPVNPGALPAATAAALLDELVT